MKTTLDLPSELMKAIKLRAVSENRTLTDLIADLLRQGMAGNPPEPRVVQHRVKLPLIFGTHALLSKDDLSPERMADILLEQEIEAIDDLMR
ncbi:MAG: hypothetical protein KC438_04530 [Thermomicrobiales bacterium]|nr:hypothetical protein [Thermomicrobiales bacterium]MCO5223312.1 hypothetical protein [Thermomicrobiales bacterium]